MTPLDDTTCIATFTRDGTRPGQTHTHGGDLSGWLEDAEADTVLRRLADDDGGEDFRAAVDAFVNGRVPVLAFPMSY